MMRFLVPFLILILCAMPFILDRGMLFLSTEILVVIAMAQAWNLLAGYGGLLSLGHHGFIGIGGYALFIATRDTGLHPYLAIPFAGFVGAGLALILAPILFRLRDVYFAVGLWVSAEILRIVVMRVDFTGNVNGMPLTAARNLNREWMGTNAYWLALALAVGVTLVVWSMMRSSFGLRLQALRDDEVAARSFGVAPKQVKLIVFMVSAGFAGMAGAVHFLSSLFITPVAAFDITWMVTLVFVTIIGGIGRLHGPILGAILYFALREYLGFSSSWYLFALGAAGVLIILFFPRGLAGLLDTIIAKFTKKGTAS